MRPLLANSYCIAALVALPVLALGTGCLDRELGPLNPCVVSGVVEEIQASNIENVDLLFMVDNSNSMMEEQAALASQFQNMARVLATGDLDDDGMQDFPPVKSLNFGVVSSDMGVGGLTVSTCGNGFFGDDGVLQANSSCASATSSTFASGGSFLNFQPATGDATTFAGEASCIATLGLNGCGFEQQLDAVLKALTPSDSELTFGSMMTRGHADGMNSGFLRSDSLVGVVVVSDEDDCSTKTPELFDQNSPLYSGGLNLRCFSYPDVLEPVQRYVDGLLDIMDSSGRGRDLLVYAAIVGVPADLIDNSEGAETNFARILDDPRMQEMVDPADPTKLQTSCNVPGVGKAYPPRRLVSVARGLQEAGANGIVQSVCQNDFTPALRAIIEKIADVLGGACLPRELNRGTDGSVNCDVTETLPVTGDYTTCASLASLGRDAEPIRREINDDGVEVEVCRVIQVIPDRSSGTPSLPAGGVGWYYDDFDPDLATRCAGNEQRISFTPGAEPKTGTLVKLECYQPARDDVGGGIRVPGDGCGDANNMPQNNVCTCTGVDCTPSISDMICDGESLTCQVPCSSNADCRNRLGLGGFICDTSKETPFCVNPTCQ